MKYIFSVFLIFSASICFSQNCPNDNTVTFAFVSKDTIVVPVKSLDMWGLHFIKIGDNIYNIEQHSPTIEKVNLISSWLMPASSFYYPLNVADTTVIISNKKIKK